MPVSLVGLLLLPMVFVSACKAGCADEKCGPSSEYLIRGSLVTVNRVGGRVTSRPTPGRVYLYTGAVPDGPITSTIHTTRSGTFQMLLSGATYYFGGRSDATGVTCTSAGPTKVGTSSPDHVTILCPSH